MDSQQISVMPDLYVDLYFRGMVKFTGDESDFSRFRGIDRVAHEYARRLPGEWDLGRIYQFGSKLPSIAKRSFALADALREVHAPASLSVTEAFLVAVNRLDRCCDKLWKPLVVPARIACAVGRRFGIAATERQSYSPRVPGAGDLWLAFSTPMTPATRRFPAKRVLLCHDMNQMFHFSEMGLKSPDLRPESNHCLDVRNDEWVVCISEYTRSRFLEYHSNFPAERAFVVPNGSDIREIPCGRTPQSILDEYELETGRYFITLATGDLHKNCAYIIEEFLAWHGADPSRQGIRLVLVGNGRNAIEPRLTEAGRTAVGRGEVLFTGFVADEHLPTLYGNSLAFIFASLAEGFGLPPLEAMRYGTPVICSDKTSLPEVVGDAGLLFDPLVAGELAGRLSEISENRNLRETLIQQGKARAAEYVWDRSAVELIGVLKKISAAESSADSGLSR